MTDIRSSTLVEWVVVVGTAAPGLRRRYVTVHLVILPDVVLQLLAGLESLVTEFALERSFVVRLTFPAHTPV